MAMTTKMPNALAQGICLLLFWSAVKGVKFYNFYITDIECIDGNVTVTMICNVNETRHGIKIFRNELEMAFCLTYSVLPYKVCRHSRRQDVITNSTLVDNSMIYSIESAQINNLIGKWVCQNGGRNDPSWSISLPNIRCKYEYIFVSSFYVLPPIRIKRWSLVEQKLFVHTSILIGKFLSKS
ncbi:unnamed protein product [Mytilus coruscus]|uniref:Uncharacterized protein n=1 Tax=Mytilus coruscus TaxID=42192 RepID=A0A6J8D6X4_MYTCO|nr:unnamed protein product [Mytilus coruscus]